MSVSIQIRATEWNHIDEARDHVKANPGLHVVILNGRPHTVTAAVLRRLESEGAEFSRMFVASGPVQSRMITVPIRQAAAPLAPWPAGARGWADEFFPEFKTPDWFFENARDVTEGNDALPRFTIGERYRLHVDAEDARLSESNVSREGGEWFRFTAYEIHESDDEGEGEFLSPPVLETNSLATVVAWAIRLGLVKNTAGA